MKKLLAAFVVAAVLGVLASSLVRGNTHTVQGKVYDIGDGRFVLLEDCYLIHNIPDGDTYSSDLVIEIHGPEPQTGEFAELTSTITEISANGLYDDNGYHHHPWFTKFTYHYRPILTPEQAVHDPLLWRCPSSIDELVDFPKKGAP